MIKGQKHSLETRARMSKSLLGHKTSQATKDKIRNAHLGKEVSQETRQKLREYNLGRKMPLSKNSTSFKSGSAHPLWKGGITKNPEYVSWSKNQWHHRNRNALGSHSFAEWETLKAQYDFTCPACHKREPEIKLSCDHIIPLSKGCSNNIENIQPLCRLCNSIKNNKTIKY